MPETRLDIYSQDDDTFVFYIDETTKIEVFKKDKYKTSMIELKHSIYPSDVYIITTNLSGNGLQIFYKFDKTWYLVEKNGITVKKQQCDSLKNSDKFCITKDGSLVLVTKELNIQLY